MSIFTSEIPKPKNADDFEQLCLIVYRVAFGDPSATRNGRSGQKQNGVDIFVVRDKQRVGIQCKRVNFGELDSKTIDQEVGFADAGNVEISELIVATTAPNDAKLVKYVHELNKLRKKNCKFSVSLAFWDALESIIQQYSELQSLLAPNLPGGAYYNLAQQGQQMLEIQQGMATTLQSLLLGIPQSQLPEASQDSLNKVISAQLDEIKETISRGRFQDALDRLLSIGSAFPSFDGHQKYRWHSQRAVCLWRLGDKSAAALQYEDAFAIAPNEDKAAANFIRASLLLDRPKEAVKRAKAAVKNFPVSPSVWSVWANAKYVAGKTVNIESVPSELRHHGEVLHTFAWINVRIGKKQLAVEQSREAYLKEPASVDARNLFLACALTYATDDPIKVALEAVDQERKGFLTEAVTAFTPFRKKLWSIQDKEVLSEASLHIAYALQLLQRVPEAHSLLYEATQSFPDIQFLNRGFLECLIRENELDAAFTFGLDRIARLDIPGLALLAQLASNRVGSDGLEAIDKIKLHIKEGGRLLEDVEAFFWVSLWRNGKTSELKEKLLAEKFETELSVTKIAVAATLAKRMKETAAVEVLLARLNEVVAHVSEPGDILQAAETNFSCDKFEEAAQLFEGLLPKGIFSEYHEKLVYCLIKSNKRRRALEVLKTAPPESFAKENVRHLAIQLAQAANDWTELNHVAALELEAKKEYVDAWLLSCVVYTNQKQFERLRQLLESAPIDLKGQTRSMAGLANYDLQFGEAKKGMARLYRMFRSDLSNPSAASGYFAVSVSAPPLFFSDNVNLISPGTTINLRTDGSDRLITIDPVEAGELPSHPSFLSASNEIAVQLIGKRIGETVSIAENFGFTRMYQITAIQSAYLHVGRLANELMHSAVVPIEGVQSVPIPIGEDGKPDLKNILDQVRRNTERINTAFTVYGSSVLTVGILAKAIGTDVVSLGTGWPETSGPQLYVCSGRKEERDAAEELLANWAGPYVTDLLTVTELVRSECEDVLSLVAPLYISQSASDTVSSLVHSAEQDPNSAYLSERDGEFTFTDNTSAMRSHRLEFIRKVRFCVDKYCIPSPAYGPETVPAEIRNIGHHLDGGSFDFLLLSLEQKALGITLDGRLRELAAQIGKIEGIWPQVLMLKALNKKTISHAIYSYAVIQALASRRTHVSLGANEIWWCLQQAPSLLQSSMRVVKQHLLDPKVEGESALLTVLELLQIVLRTPAQLGAICEISEHMFAAVFAHPSVDATSAHALATQRLSEILGAVFASVNRGWVEQSLAAPKLESWKNQVERSLGRARELSRKSKEEIIALPLRVVSPFCFRVPRLIFTGPESIKTSLE